MTPTTRLEDVVDIGELKDAVSKGLVSNRRHGDLRILNYTSKCSAERVWNRTTKACRGLIHTTDGIVVARPFAKFFNAGDPSGPRVPTGGGWEMSVQDKLDGALGVGYRDPETGRYSVSSRGSLESDQAATADRIWHEKYRRAQIPDGVTPVFEIISPKHRILVDYGELEDLVLLAVIDISTGGDLGVGSIDWKGPVAEDYPVSDWDEAARIVERRSAAGEDFEGVVVTFSRPGHESRRFKMKSKAYLERHDLAYRWPVRRIWREAAGRHVATTCGVTDARRLGGLLRIDHAWCEGLLGRLDEPGRNLRTVTQDGPTREARRILELLDSMEKQASDQITTYERLAAEVGPTPEGRGGRRQHAAEVDAAARRLRLEPGPLFSLCRGDRAGAHATVWRSVLASQLRS